jgi:hypothetical protein
MGQAPNRRPAVAALLGLWLFTLSVALIPNAIPALEAVGRFVARPAVAVLLVVAVLGPAGLGFLRRGNRP